MKAGRMLVLALSSLILGICPLAAGAVKAETIPEAMQENRAMRKNITWMVKGLRQLGECKDKRLRLTGKQARQIFPIYRELIAKKIILMEAKPEPSAHAGKPNPPEMDLAKDQQRMAELMELTEFGKRQSRRIDSLLTEAQVRLIDNLDFKPEKYGYFENSGPPRWKTDSKVSGFPNGDRPTPPDEKTRGKMEKGRQLLVKLNRDVYEMLKWLR